MFQKVCCGQLLVFTLLMPVKNALSLPNPAANKKCKYPEVCFNGCTINLWEHFLFSTDVRFPKQAIITVNIRMIFQP